MNCKLCGKPKQEWQVFCGSACSALWEMGERPLPPPTPEDLTPIRLVDRDELLAEYPAPSGSDDNG